MRPPRSEDTPARMPHSESLPAPPPPRAGLAYRRILLKLSGEALCGEDGGFGIRPETLQRVAAEIAEVSRMGVQIGIVVGGGNIFRGLKGASAGMDRSQSDYMGMLATVINDQGQLQFGQHQCECVHQGQIRKRNFGIRRTSRSTLQ